MRVRVSVLRLARPSFACLATFAVRSACEDWVMAWQTMSIPVEKQGEALQKFLNMAFSEAGMERPRIALGARERRDGHIVRSGSCCIGGARLPQRRCAAFVAWLDSVTRGHSKLQLQLQCVCIRV